jgi:DNA-binding Lrp family transcriptional regulator
MTVATRAHLLLQVDPGRSQEAVTVVGALPAVTDAVVTSGPYDVIATLAVADEDELRRVVRQARRVPGLCMLRVCRPG